MQELACTQPHATAAPSKPQPHLWEPGATAAMSEVSYKAELCGSMPSTLDHNPFRIWVDMRAGCGPWTERRDWLAMGAASRCPCWLPGQRTCTHARARTGTRTPCASFRSVSDYIGDPFRSGCPRPPLRRLLEDEPPQVQRRQHRRQEGDVHERLHHRLRC